MVKKAPVAKATPTSRPWWKSDIMIGALSMLIILIVTETLFSVPSRWFTPTPTQKIDIDRGDSGATTPTARCTREYRPVCGADKKTYANSCLANAAQTIVVSEGACSDPVENTGTTTETSVSTGSNTSTSGITEGTRPVTTEDYTDSKKFHIYSNPRIGYSMAFPAYAYYQGYGARDGAIHTMAMGLTEADIADFDTAPVRVWFYKTPPANPPSTQSVTLQNGVLYVANSSDEPKVRKIVIDILASAQ